MLKTKVNCSIEQSLKAYAIENGINFKDALEFGLLFLAAEKGLMEHPANSVSEKLKRAAERLDKAIEQLIELEEAPAGGEKIYPENSYGN